MSASSSPSESHVSSPVIYASKLCTELAVARLGASGWIKVSETELEGVIFVRTPGTQDLGWVVTETHQKNVLARKKYNLQTFGNCPHGHARDAQARSLALRFHSTVERQFVTVLQFLLEHFLYKEASVLP
jgi:hypothetical protein